MTHCESMHLAGESHFESEEVEMRWLVMYGRGRALRRPGSGGGVSFVKSFETEAAAKAFVIECTKAGMRANMVRR
jgi:hypothetical protein